MTVVPATRPATETPHEGDGGAVKRAAGGPAPRGAWALIDRAKAGDTDAFADLYKRYRPAIFVFIRGKVQHAELAEDLTHDTFVRAFRYLSTVDFQGRDPMAWLVIIARNLVLDYWKSSRYRTEARTVDGIPPDTIDPHVRPDDAAVAAATRRTLLAAVAQLPDKQRRVIELRYFADLSVAETAARTGDTEGAVKALAFRAIRALGRHLTLETA